MEREGNRGLGIERQNSRNYRLWRDGTMFRGKTTRFWCKSSAYDKYKTNFGSDQVEEVELDELQTRADIVSIHVPLTSETRGMINSEFINAFAKPFYFVNSARGKSVVTKDLVGSAEEWSSYGSLFRCFEYESSAFTEIKAYQQI